MKRQVHRQERHVRDRIGVAKAVREFDAIDDDEIVRRRCLGKKIDVVQMQIAVRIARHRTAGALVDQSAATLQMRFGQGTHSFENHRRHRRSHQRRSLLKILTRILGDDGESAERGNPRA